MTTSGNGLPSSYRHRIWIHFLAAWDRPMRFSSLLQGYRRWLPARDSWYVSRALRQAYFGAEDNNDHVIPSHTPEPATARSGKSSGHLSPPLVAVDKGRPRPLRPRWQRQAANCAVPFGRSASLVNPAR